MNHELFSYERFCSHFSVSRETYQKLETYVSLICKWQASVNLVSGSTIPAIWTRHILDSYQLVGLMPSGKPLIDMGSGGGLPAIVLSIAGYAVSLVESDGKKVAFLREVSRVLSLNNTILHQRVEATSLRNVSIITARAFAPVAAILLMLQKELTSSHKLFLLKGKNWREEIGEAEKSFAFVCETHTSITDPSGVILILSNIQRRGVTSA